jgi:hypothetical protein
VFKDIAVCARVNPVELCARPRHLSPPKPPDEIRLFRTGTLLRPNESVMHEHDVAAGDLSISFAGTRQKDPACGRNYYAAI